MSSEKWRPFCLGLNVLMGELIEPHNWMTAINFIERWFYKAVTI